MTLKSNEIKVKSKRLHSKHLKKIKIPLYEEVISSINKKGKFNYLRKKKPFCGTPKTKSKDKSQRENVWNLLIPDKG